MKSIFKSKTFWVSIVWVIFNLANYFGYGFEYTDAEGVVDQDWGNIVNAVFGGMMIVLRVLTNKGVYIVKQ